MTKNDLTQVVEWATTPQRLAHWKQIRPIRTVSGERWKLELLWEEPPFQIERATVLPDSVVPIHRHPNADSWECYVAGDLMLSINGHCFTINEHTRRNKLPVLRTSWHGADIGPKGAQFLSIQKWFSKPRAITDDWEAYPNDPAAGQIARVQ